MPYANEDSASRRPRPDLEADGAGTEAAAELHYAPSPPLRRRRATRRIIIVAFTIIALLASIRWYPQVREHVLILLWQRACLNHRAPRDQVVFDQDPERVAALLRDPRYQSGPPPHPEAFLVPPQWPLLFSACPPGSALSSS